MSERLITELHGSRPLKRRACEYVHSFATLMRRCTDAHKLNIYKEFVERKLQYAFCKHFNCDR